MNEYVKMNSGLHRIKKKTYVKHISSDGVRAAGGTVRCALGSGSRVMLQAQVTSLRERVKMV